MDRVRWGHNGAIDTDLDDPEIAEPEEPPVRYEKVKLPWTARLVIVALLVAACTFFWWSTRRTADTSLNGKGLDPAIVSLNPAPGDRVPPQAQISVQLKQGYDGRLSIDGTPIPEDQMEGAVPTNSPEYRPELGVRPNNKNELYFIPGKGKAVVKLSPGEVVVTVRLWNIRDGERNSRTSRYTILVN